MEITQLQHPDFVWTWKTNKRAKKVGLWIPYFQRVEKVPKAKSRYLFTFNGGEVICYLKQIDFLMLYGATGELPVNFLDELSVNKIPLIIHRRNMPEPLVFYPSTGKYAPDILSAQIITRENMIKRAYIARTLVFHRFKAMENIIPVSRTVYKRLASSRDITSIRALEANITKKYWIKYYKLLNVNTTRRDKTNPINKALDAGSFFLFGSILRWSLFHKLSPCHAFLHQPTSYPSLCYDLMEPYRYIIDEAVFEAADNIDPFDEKRLTAMALENIKGRMEQDVFVPATKQVVATKNLLHGIVLALRSYLLQESRRFIVPKAGEKKGGRPLKAGFLLPGAK